MRQCSATVVTRSGVPQEVRLVEAGRLASLAPAHRPIHDKDQGQDDTYRLLGTPRVFDALFPLKSDRYSSLGEPG